MVGSGLFHIFCQFSLLEKEFFIMVKIEYFFFTAQTSKKVENNKRNSRQKGIRK